MAINNNVFRHVEIGIMAVRATARVQAIAAECGIIAEGTTGQLRAATTVDDKRGPNVPLEETGEAEDLATILVRGVKVDTVDRGDAYHRRRGERPLVRS